MTKAKTALITGASRGIGYGVALRLAQEGIKTAIVGRDRKRIEEAAKKITEVAGMQTLAVVGDVSIWSDCVSVVEEVAKEFDSIDVLVPNAGVGVIGSVEESNPLDWAVMMETNYLGTAHIVKAVLPVMQRQGTGDVVAIVSAGGTKGYPEWSGYCATKWAVMGFMDSFAQEVITQGIRVSTLCPGGVDTVFWDNLNKDMYSAGSVGRSKLMSPADVAELVMLQINLPRNVLLKNALFFPTNEWH
ncbi:MAG: SDR family NAD(P)-dependent oxidoreductase [Actinomycetota bacterium]|nr:SDR family NAD(P)-dependent oxidoreductase [Actinomycetota bacterium]